MSLALMNGSEPLGIFGGTFDPVHLGHLRLAEEAIEALGLSEVLWIPAGQPAHRAGPQVPAQDRLRMVRLATAGNPGFSVDATEVEQNAPSYTVPTLERLRVKLGPQRPLVLLLGADAFVGLPGWHRWTALFDLAHVAVAHRPGFQVAPERLPAALAEAYLERSSKDPADLQNQPAGRVFSFAMTPLDISATQVRRKLAAGKSVRYLLPEAIIAHIQQHHLYFPAG